MDKDRKEMFDEIYTFFMWFRYYGETYLDRSIEEMINLYLDDREIGDVLGRIEKKIKKD